MKKWYILTALFLSLLFTISIGIRNEYTIKTIQNEIASEVLRFHVRANSDTEEDQKIKMQVKEAVVTYLNPLLDEIRNVGTAKLLVENHLSGVEKIIHEKLNDIGCSYGFQVKITKEYFPRKTYGDCTFPEGNYEAVVITLGKGAGQNWWCMLYPGLCFLDGTYAIASKENDETEAVVPDERKKELAEVLTEDAYQWITDSEYIKVKFRIQWLNELFQ